MINVHKAVLFLLLIVVATTTTLSGQNRGVHFIDSLTRKPVPGVEIYDQANNLRSSADALGYAELSAPESSVLHITCLGFISKYVRLLELREPIILLKPNVAQLAEVQVCAPQQPADLGRLAEIDLHLRPVQNAQDFLRVVPGLFIGQHAGGGKAEQIFLRGFDIDHGTDINITADGIPVNLVSHAHGQGYADLHFLIPELIEEIDFDKGLYRADKGNFTTAGYVDLRTQNILEKSFVKGEVGQFNAYRTVVGVNFLPSRLAAKNQHLYMACEAMKTQGYFDHPQDFKRLNSLIKYHGRIKHHSILNASLSGFSSRWNASGQIPQRAVDSGQIGYFGAIDATEGGLTSRVNAQTHLTTEIMGGAILKNQMYYSNYTFELFSNFTFFKDNPTDGDQIRQKERRHIFGYQNSINKRTEIFGITGEAEAGIQTRFDFIEDKSLSRTKNRTTTITSVALGDVREQNLAAYFNQRWQLGPRLSLSTGARFDYFHYQYNDALLEQRSTAQTQLISPKLKLHFQAKEQVEFYLANGRGFHSNDALVSVAQNGNRVLPPAYGTDLGVMCKITDRILFQSAIWYLHMAQEFVYVGDEGIVEAGDASRRLGFDASIRWQLTKYLFADLDYTYSNARTGADFSERIPLAPRFTSAGGLVYRKLQGINASLRYRYLANRAANADNSLIAQGYLIFDANLHYATPRYEVGIAAQNLLNTRWKETQFETESRLPNEASPISEIHFTPGTPFAAKLYAMYKF